MRACATAVKGVFRLNIRADIQAERSAKQNLVPVTRAAGRRHRFTGPVTKRLDHARPRSPLHRRPGSPISREIQTAGYVSKRGWDDSVQISGTPRHSTPRAVHLPAPTVKRIPMTPGAARLSAWRNAKVRAYHMTPHQAAANSRLGLRVIALVWLSVASGMPKHPHTPGTV